MKLKRGQRIKYQWTHWLNSSSAIERSKFGIFVGYIKHTCRWKGDQLAGVVFDDNDGRMTRVPVYKLSIVKK